MSDEPSAFEQGGLSNPPDQIPGPATPPDEDEETSEPEDEETSRSEESTTSSSEDVTTLPGVRAEMMEELGVYVFFLGGEAIPLPASPDASKEKRGYKLRRPTITLLDAFSSWLEVSGSNVPTTHKSEIVEAALQYFLLDWITNGEDSAAAEWYRHRNATE